MPFDLFKSDPLSREQREQELINAHEALGARREEVRQVFETNPNEFAVTIKFGRGVGQSDMSGRKYTPSQTDQATVEDESADSAALFPRVAHTTIINEKLVAPIKGAAYGNKRIGNLTIPCGVCLIVGKGGAGKTPLAHYLAGYGVEDYAAVRIGEPLSGYSQSEEEAALSIATAMVSSRNVVVDSIKDLLASGSNLMKSGLSRSVLTTISDWSALANDLGCTLYIPINPSSDDDEVYSLLVEAARSNATVTVSHTGGNGWEVSGRTGEGLPRFSSVKLIFENDGVIVDGIKAKRAAKDKIEGGFEARSTVASREAIQRIIKV